MSDKQVYRILVVDDDQDILDLLEYNLEKEGFKVKTVSDSGKAIRVAKSFHPDLIILDIMMPHPNGIEICRYLRNSRGFEDTYIFFLTARSESYFVQAALDTGGDDFIEKIVGLRALTYKVSTVLKQHFVIRKSIAKLTVGSLTLNRNKLSVKIGKRELMLSKPEFELLFFFAQNPGKQISIDSLIQTIWGSEIYLVELSIEAYIKNLRKKIGHHVLEQTIDRHFYLSLTW